MAYAQGQVITAADFNTIRTDVNDVYADNNAGSTVEANANFGYGQTAISSVSAGQVITAAQWTSLFDAIDLSGTHQNTSTGIVPASVSAGQVITAYDGGTGLLQVVTDIRTNRLLVDASEATITTNGTKDQSTRTTAWNTQLIHEFTVDFGTYDAARHFFNTGGQIRMSADRSGGTANQPNTDWTNLLIAIGDVVFDHTETNGGGTGTSTAIGFYNLTGTFQTVYDAAGSVPYELNTVTYEARADGGLGSSGLIRFRITYDDGETTTDIDGTFNSNVDERRSTGAITITSPTFATITEVTAGT